VISVHGRQPQVRILGNVPLPSPAAEPSLMAMSHAAERWTAEMVRALPDDGHRYELISGELVVTPSPRALHQVAISELEALLRQPAADRGLHLLHSPADISLGGRDPAARPLHLPNDIGPPAARLG